MTLLEATRDSLIIRMTNRGYARADALANYEIPPDDRHSARVRYDIIPGPLSRFGDIEIVGAEKVDTSVVRRMLTFRQGDLFSTQALLESQRNLFDQAVFRHASQRKKQVIDQPLAEYARTAPKSTLGLIVLKPTLKGLEC